MTTSTRRFLRTTVQRASLTMTCDMCRARLPHAWQIASYSDHSKAVLCMSHDAATADAMAVAS